MHTPFGRDAQMPGGHRPLALGLLGLGRMAPQLWPLGGHRRRQLGKTGRSPPGTADQLYLDRWKHLFTDSPQVTRVRYWKSGDGKATR